MIKYEKPLDDFIIDVIVKNAYSNNLSLFNGCCADIIVLNEAAKIFNNSNLNSLLDERIRFLKKNINSCKSLNFYNGYAGVFFTLAYLQNNHRNLLSCADYSVVDNVFFDFIRALAHNNNYDLLWGLIGFGIYYIEVSKLFHSKRNFVNLIIKAIINMSKRTHDGLIYWKYTQEYLGNSYNYEDTINLGMLHGMPSIISFLIMCLNDGYYSVELYEVIKVAFLSLCNFKHDNGICLYSFSCSIRDNRIVYNNNSTELYYCYGDLGVANSFIAGENLFCDNQEWKQCSKQILEKIQIRLLNTYSLSSYCFCHGWAYLLYFITSHRQALPLLDCSKQACSIMQVCLQALFTKKLQPGILTGFHGLILSILNTYADIYPLNELLLLT